MAVPHRMEVKKHAMRQSQEGTWTVTWVIHPSDMPMELVSAPPGTRYYVDIEEANDEEGGAGEGAAFVKEASALCASERFQDWLFRHAKYEAPREASKNTRMQLARALLRDELHVVSLTWLTGDTGAQARYSALVRRYQKDVGLIQ